MNKVLYKHWLDIIYPLLPDKASVTNYDHSKNFEASISWELDNDAKRPHKESRVIEIEVPDEVIDEYEAKSKERKEMDDKKLALQISEFFQDFNPNHDTPVGQATPKKRIVIGRSVLNS